MLFAAATDHRYLDGGHALDFVNKALETLDLAGWELAEPALSSLARGLADAGRMEESNAWRHPVDLVEILEAGLRRAARRGPRNTGDAGAAGTSSSRPCSARTRRRARTRLLVALRDGASAVDVASAVTFAAALRIARFPTSNEFGDWDTALHTFTFANAVEQGLAPGCRRDELLRGVFDAAMSVYLDRFLNVPAARLPGANGSAALDDLTPLSTTSNRSTRPVRSSPATSTPAAGTTPLQARLAHLLLREDRDFHTIQSVEAAFRQLDRLGPGDDSRTVLIAAARYLAAHAPTVRAQGQTFEIAWRLHRGERLYEEV